MNSLNNDFFRTRFEVRYDIKGWKADPRIGIEFFTKDNLNRVFYFKGKETVMDILNFKISTLNYQKDLGKKSGEKPVDQFYNQTIKDQKFFNSTIIKIKN